MQSGNVGAIAIGAERAPSAAARAHRLRFYACLIAVTVLPYLLFPLTKRVFPENASLNALVSVLLFLGAGGHVAASFFFYSDPEMRAFMREGRYLRYLIVPALLLVLSTLLFVLTSPLVQAYALVAFWVWQVHHFSRQNQGILAFASRADGSSVTRLERLAVSLTGVAAILATLVIVTPYRATPLGPYDTQIHRLALGVFGCAWLVYACTLRAEAWRKRPLRELTRFALMAFYAPLFVFRDAFSAVFIYLVAHGLQYLVFMLFVVSVPAQLKRRSALILAGFTLLGGAAIELARRPSTWSATLGSALLGASLGIVMWHFLLDAGLWRLRQAFPRRYMSRRFLFLASTAQPGTHLDSPRTLVTNS
ncbi:MAG TPA: hypothetical protein VK524_24020 [Polyangiaceae bacterium]|nr:hypothetical protein [Polyangiaceae bacterium]